MFIRRTSQGYSGSRATQLNKRLGCWFYVFSHQGLAPAPLTPPDPSSFWCFNNYDSMLIPIFLGQLPIVIYLSHHQLMHISILSVTLKLGFAWKWATPNSIHWFIKLQHIAPLKRILCRHTLEIPPIAMIFHDIPIKNKHMLMKTSSVPTNHYFHSSPLKISLVHEWSLKYHSILVFISIH